MSHYRIIAVQTRSYPTLEPPPPSSGAPWGIFFHPGADGRTGASELWVMPITGGTVGDPALYWTAPLGHTITCLFYSTLSGQGRVYVGTWSGARGYLYSFAEGQTPGGFGETTILGSPTHAAEFGGMLYLSLTRMELSAACYLERVDPRTGYRATVCTSPRGSSGRGGLAVQGGVLYWSDGANVYASSDGSAWSKTYSEPPTPAWPWVGVDSSPRSLGGLVSDQATGAVYVGGQLNVYYMAQFVGRVMTFMPAIWSLEGGSLVECWRAEVNWQHPIGAINSLRYLDSGGARSGPYGHSDVGSPTSPLLFAAPTGLVGDIPTGYGTMAPPNQAMASYGGTLYAILYTPATSAYYESTLARFDGGAWSAVRRFPYCRPDTSGCICVPNTGYLCHEV